MRIAQENSLVVPLSISYKHKHIYKVLKFADAITAMSNNMFQKSKMNLNGLMVPKFLHRHTHSSTPLAYGPTPYEAAGRSIKLK